MNNQTPKSEKPKFESVVKNFFKFIFWAIITYAAWEYGCNNEHKQTPTDIQNDKQINAQITVKEYIKIHLNNPNSYEDAGWAELTPAKANGFLDPKDTIRTVSYLIKHIFRAKNQYGALILDSAVFELDTSLTKIRDVSFEARGLIK